MHRSLITIVALTAGLTAALAAEQDIVLRGMGSFHVGGRVVEISGKPVREIVRQPGGPLTKLDPNGQYMVEQMYVQFFLPKERKGKLPLLLWHGGGLTGVTYESTPDGREGWLNMFVRKGWDTYVSDAVERGRAGFAPSGSIAITSRNTRAPRRRSALCVPIAACLPPGSGRAPSAASTKSQPSPSSRAPTTR